MDALTKQNGVRLLGKLKKKLKKKSESRPTLPKFLQEEIGNPHIFFWPKLTLFILSSSIISKLSFVDIQ
jgi:hypothetical protein